jgi:RsmE family RNA methyltransferase
VNLILLHAAEIAENGVVELTGARAVHIATVLNAEPGQELRIGRIDGPHGTGTVARVDAGRVLLHCRFDASAPVRPQVDLLLALPRPKVMRRLWSQIAALGVGQVILTNAARVERDYFGTHWLDASVYTSLMIEGLQQARDTLLPGVSVHRRFKVLIEDDLDTLYPAGARVAAQPGHETTFAGVLAAAPAERILVAVGPEGGWTEFELSLLERHRFRAVGMGPRTLRSDTATIALLTLAHQALASRNALATND